VIVTLREETPPSSAPSTLVTVVVPCFNYGRFLAETLESVIRQSHRRWECIIVDDGSTDDTRRIAQSYVARDTRFRYLHQHHRGASAARNLGIHAGRGECFQFLDADDLIEPRKLEHHLRHLHERGDVEIVYSPVRYFASERSHERRYSMREPDHPWMPQASGRGLPLVSVMARTNLMAINCPLVRRHVIDRAGGFDERLDALEDWDYWLRCALDGTWFQYLDEPETYALVRQHPASTSQDTLRVTRALLPLCRGALRSTSDAGARALFAWKLASARHDLYILQLRQNMPVRGLLNGLALELSEKRYRVALQCFFALVLLPFIGKRRASALLLDVPWSRSIRKLFLGVTSIPSELPGGVAKTSSQQPPQQRGLPP
jgi:glycosyltransferase involved in cell wall biosynthesis